KKEKKVSFSVHAEKISRKDLEKLKEYFPADDFSCQNQDQRKEIERAIEDKQVFSFRSFTRMFCKVFNISLRKYEKKVKWIKFQSIPFKKEDMKMGELISEEIQRLEMRKKQYTFYEVKSCSFDDTLENFRIQDHYLPSFYSIVKSSDEKHMQIQEKIVEQLLDDLEINGNNSKYLSEIAYLFKRNGCEVYKNKIIEESRNRGISLHEVYHLNLNEVELDLIRRYPEELKYLPEFLKIYSSSEKVADECFEKAKKLLLSIQGKNSLKKEIHRAHIKEGGSNLSFLLDWIDASKNCARYERFANQLIKKSGGDIDSSKLSVNEFSKAYQYSKGIFVFKKLEEKKIIPDCFDKHYKNMQLLDIYFEAVKKELNQLYQPGDTVAMNWKKHRNFIGTESSLEYFIGSQFLELGHVMMLASKGEDSSKVIDLQFTGLQDPRELSFVPSICSDVFRINIEGLIRDDEVKKKICSVCGKDWKNTLQNSFTEAMKEYINWRIKKDFSSQKVTRKSYVRHVLSRFKEYWKKEKKGEGSQSDLDHFLESFQSKNEMLCLGLNLAAYAEVTKAMNVYFHEELNWEEEYLFTAPFSDREFLAISPDDFLKASQEEESKKLFTKIAPPEILSSVVDL
ncbi:MAG: hypothetical protein CMO81_07990, partial [Waddliaceae bacterium]|nr:hypothetical protein [Waddliaceae bacterium]